MSKGVDVLERTSLPAGKVFIRQGEENARAYVIQNGEVRAFITDEDQKIEVARHGPGTIIGEECLVVDEPAKVSYETITAATVITFTRHDFQKRLVKAGKGVNVVFEHAVNKLIYYQNSDTAKALSRMEIDDTTRALVNSLLTGLSEDKRVEYENALLPHVHGMVQEIKTLKEKGRDEE